MGYSLELDLVPVLALLARAADRTALVVDTLRWVALAGPILWSVLPFTAAGSATGLERLPDCSAVSHVPLVVLA